MKTGEWYLFQIGNVIEIPGVEPQQVLISHEGTRYLIPSLPYKDYNLETGKMIRCKVDKINCSGRVFLEPEHPVYAEGNSYGFHYERKLKRFNVLGKEECLWVLKDNAGKEVELLISPEYFTYEPKQLIDCKVIRIKKSRLFLGHEFSLKPNDSERAGQWEYLDVIDTEMFYQGELYYVLSDIHSEKHLLKTKHFSAYGFKQGQKVYCKFVKWKPTGFWVLEPQHPLYKEGECYPFLIDAVENALTDDNEIAFHVIDFHNNDILLTAPYTEKESIQKGNSCVLQVSEIRKGKPVLLWND